MVDRLILPLAWGLFMVAGAAVAMGSDERAPTERYRSWVAEYEAAEDEYQQAFRAAKTIEERRSVSTKRPDPIPFARKMLGLVEGNPEEPIAIEALVWIVRHAGRSTEARQAVARIGDRYARDPKVGVICAYLSSPRTEDGELLRRIAEENPNPSVRAQAFLRLAIRERILRRDAARLRGLPEGDLARVEDPELRAQLEALRDIPLSRFDEESERWLDRVLKEGPEVLEGENVLNVCTFLSRSVLPNAGRTLRRIEENHPDPETRAFACWCLAGRAERMADWAARLRGASTVQVDRLREDLGALSIRILEEIDPKKRTDDANRLLQETARRMDVVPFEDGSPSMLWLMLSHIADSDPGYSHLEALEPLLLSILEEHPRPEVQALVCRALAAHLLLRAELIARLRPLSGPHQVSWLERLGEDRFEALRSLDPAALSREAENWLERSKGSPVRLGTIGEQVLDRLAVAIGKVGPEIEAKDIEGRVFKLSDYRGKVVLLSFWGMWCGPCREMIPHEKALVERFGGESFAVLGVNNDPDRSKLERYLKDEGISWRNWWCPGELIAPVIEAWRPGGWPTLYLLDSRGGVRGRFVGYTEFETLEAAVEDVLNDRSPGEASPNGSAASGRR